ncbi:hypothetical protein EGH21_11100 [Halomicroarcula sp. F13]|uniref:DUF7978 domain-containing protein n=1 Tax=Haloarcula rubra TaxID=2487747 RepID=A0AAW4PQR5_9EURY|nr:hypothetical protein [Halomicroarcula rubra]MBX0323575.1 hypothetical protein [Halomicroarcula rubra]
MTTEPDTDASVADTGGQDTPLLSPALETFPWLEASTAALGTFVVEYLAVAALFVVGPSSVDRSVPAIDSTAAVFVQYAHVLFNAHHVPTVLKASIQIAGSPFGNDLYLALASGGASVPPVVYFLIPMVALTVAGGLFEGRRRPNPTGGRLREAALVGVGFTVGYLAVGLVGALTLVQRWDLTTAEGVVGSASQQPDPYFTAVLFLLFPMVFLPIGAAMMYGRGAQA